MHWISSYLKLKYRAGGRGPEEVDCYGLLRLIYLEQFQIELPLIPGQEQASLRDHVSLIRDALQGRDWVEVLSPFDGCAVAMSQAGTLHHVGIYIEADGGKVVHGWKGPNIIADTLMNLKIKGFNTIIFYQHRLWPSS